MIGSSKRCFGALIRGHSKRGLGKSSTVLEQLLLVCCTFAKLPFAMSPKRGSRAVGVIVASASIIILVALL